MSKHALLQPSSAYRWTVCPGSVRLCALVPDAGGAAADQGSACHTMLKEVLDAGDLRGEGEEVLVVNEAVDRATRVRVTKEMRGWVLEAQSWVSNYMRGHAGCTLYTETKAHVGRALGAPDDIWGTSDVVIVNPAERELVVADAKFGYVEVELEWQGEAEADLMSPEAADAPTEHNDQLVLYGIGVAEQWGWAFDSVRLAVLQPRSEAPVKETVLPASILRAYQHRYRRHVAAALAPDAPLVVTDEGCRFCTAAAICPALQERAQELARREFASIETLPLEQLGELVLAKRRIEAGLKAAQAHATRLLTLGVRVPGLKLVRGTKHRTWLNQEVAKAALIDDCGQREADVEERKLISPAQAEKLVGKRDAKKLEPWIEKPRGELVAAPLDDKRDAELADFAPVDEAPKLL